MWNYPFDLENTKERPLHKPSQYQSKYTAMGGVWIFAERCIGETYGNNTRMRDTHRFKFEIGLSPRMHQMSNNRYYPNGYVSLRVTQIFCGLETPKRHGKNAALLYICILFILPSEIINNKYLLKHGWFSHFMHTILVKNDSHSFNV